MRATKKIWCSKQTLHNASVRAIIFICFISAAALYSGGCNNLLYTEEQQTCKLTFSINESSFYGMKSGIYEQRSVWSNDMANLDTNNFILSIYTQDGSKVYDGKYGKRPNEIIVLPGAYDIKLSSGDFHTPEFDSPQYGDEQTIIVEANSSISVTLMCKQLNAAMRISFTAGFKEKFSGKGVKLRDVNGEMFYPYNKYDFCYVQPGAVELLYEKNSTDTLLFTRQLSASQMLSLNLSYAPGNRTASLKLDTDTTKNWKSENFNTGLKIPTGAVTIEQAKEMVGEKNVMVFGFILGGDASETTIRVGPPFTSRTNIVIAPSMLERNRNNMFVVELPSGEIRDALNLVVNSKLQGSAIVITGNIVDNYYGYPGLKNVKAYSILY